MSRPEVITQIVNEFVASIAKVDGCTADEVLSAAMTFAQRVVYNCIEGGGDPDAIRWGVEKILLLCGDRSVRH